MRAIQLVFVKSTHVVKSQEKVKKVSYGKISSNRRVITIVDPNFCDTLWALYFRYQQTPFCNEENRDAKFYSTERIFRFRHLDGDIDDFRGNPVKVEFGAKTSKSDFFSLDGSK